MKTRLKVIDAQSLQRLLKQQGKAMAAESEKILKMMARALASDYGRQTDPPDAFGPDVVEKYKARIARENRYVFPTREDAGKVFELIKQRDPVLANAYYHAVKSQKVSQAAALMRKAGLPQGSPTVAALKAARTLARARVSSRSAPVTLLRASESRRFTREQQNKVGTAKAGWHQAAKAIGGRVRSNFVDADGKRSTAERFPKYVRNVSRRYGDLGGAIVGEGRIVIYSNVRHASEALNERRKASAESDAQERVLKAVRIMISKMVEKFNRYTAA